MSTDSILRIARHRALVAAVLQAFPPEVCRCCGKPMDYTIWTKLRPPGGMPFATVWCVNDACPLKGYDFVLSEYQDIDLVLYAPPLTGKPYGEETPEHSARRGVEIFGGEGAIHLLRATMSSPNWTDEKRKFNYHVLFHLLVWRRREQEARGE